MEDMSVRDLELALEKKKLEEGNSSSNKVTTKRESPKKEKRLNNLKVTDYLVLICLLSIVGFVLVVMYQYYVHGIPVIDLKTEIFTFFGVELLAMASISISNNVKKK